MRKTEGKEKEKEKEKKRRRHSVINFFQKDK